MGNTKRGISDFFCFLTEDCSEESFFGCELGFALGRDLTDKNVARVNLCADADNSALVKVFESVVADIRDISCDFFRSELCVSCFNVMILNMNRGVDILTKNS